MKTYRCNECRWVGPEDKIDMVEDPRPPVGRIADKWAICPSCRTPENLVLLCDEPGCTLEGTCGAPSPTGYRWTCYQHSKMAKQRAAEVAVKHPGSGCIMDIE